MNRRAMTMVELLLALALLSGLTIACVGWTTAMTRAAAMGDGAWGVGAERTLSLVDEVLRTEDTGLAEGRDRRVEIGAGSILLRGRRVVADAAGRPVVSCALRLETRDGGLRAHWLDGSGMVAESRPLLDGVEAFEARKEDLEDGRVLLTLRLVARSGAPVERRWRLAREEVR
ncbi:MAG: hypothetical protein IPJ41_16975 [Phycisphaerales bacterium]|nr:hypothetical protein [Phycisphaerales bacterium]